MTLMSVPMIITIIIRMNAAVVGIIIMKVRPETAHAGHPERPISTHRSAVQMIIRSFS